MSKETWNVRFLIHRQKTGQPPRLEAFPLEVNPEEYVLDGVERIWAFRDRSLTFAHACHHSTCGACGMRVNGTEKLTCITRIRDVTQNGGVLKIEPLRNFPVVSDLVVDMGALYTRMEKVGARSVLSLADAPTTPGIARAKNGDLKDAESYQRLADCIECGLCISACPVAATDPTYLGPAPLAAAQQRGVAQNPQLMQIVDSAEGVWRCHSAYECTEVCPSFVEPAWRIMDLRKQVVVRRVQQLFGGK